MIRTQIDEVLKQIFGIDSGFRDGQLDAILATLMAQDSLLILPTGAGKSLTYQLPPFTRKAAFTVVVSPLLALAKDQVEKAKDQGIDAVLWNSQVCEAHRLRILADLVSTEPDIRLLYTTPESLVGKDFRLREALKESQVSGTLLSFAIDEAHCISEWGHDFRPAYLELRNLKDDFPKVPIACMTASCTSQVQSSIISTLRLKNATVIKRSFNRPNIQYMILYKDCLIEKRKGSEAEIIENMVQSIKARGDECGIVYARLRETCDRIGKELENHDVEAAVYHAGKDMEIRSKVQSEWSSGAIKVVVATVAFGMGIDKPDVRWVYHFNPPSSLEGFYQESGRAGRDGLPCISVVYSSQSDLQEMYKLEKANRRGSIKEVDDFLMRTGCRRKKILSFFGEKRDSCNVAEEELCDFCRDPQQVILQLKRLERQQQEEESLDDQPSLEHENIKKGSYDSKPAKRACTWSTASTFVRKEHSESPGPPESAVNRPTLLSRHSTQNRGLVPVSQDMSNIKASAHSQKTEYFLESDNSVTQIQSHLICMDSLKEEHPFQTSNLKTDYPPRKIGGKPWTRDGTSGLHKPFRPPLKLKVEATTHGVPNP